LHYETVMVAILVVQAKMFLGGLNLNQHPIGRPQVWIVTVLPNIPIPECDHHFA
jgi:hypothetical protein